MNLNGEISYNGWTNSLVRSAGGGAMDGYIVENVRASNVDATAYLEKKALQDGLDAFDVFLGARRLDVDIAVYGSSRGAFWDNADALIAAFSPVLAFDADTANSGFLPFNFEQPTANTSDWTSGLIPLRYYVRPLAPPTFDIRRDAAGGTDAKGMSGVYRASLIAKDPRKYLQTEISVTMLSTSQTAVYRGNYQTWPTITYTLAGSGHSALTFTIKGRSIVIDMSAQTSGTFTVDFSLRTLVKSPSTKLTGSATWATLDVGPETTTYSRSNDTNLSSGVLTYREAWA